MAGTSSLVDDALKAALRATEGTVAREAVPVVQDAFKATAHPTATPDAKALVDYLNSSRGHLPMDQDERMARRADMGHDSPDLYHGAPRDIEGFDNRHSNAEGYWGGHHYATTSPVDASENYAHPLGADIAQRVGQVKDQLFDNFHPDDVKQWFKDTYNRDLTDAEAVSSQNVGEWSDALAHDQLGITNRGAVYPVTMRLKNPVRIESPNQTHWEHQFGLDENGDLMDDEGPAVELLKHTKEALSDYDVDPKTVDEVLTKLWEHAADNGGISAQDYDHIVRNTVQYIADPMSGDMVSPGHMMSDVFQRMGHDGIIMNTDVFAPGPMRKGMAGTGGSTQHYITFDPKNIRSRFGAYDPFKADSTRLSDHAGGRVERNDGGRVAKSMGGSRGFEAAMEIIRRELSRLKGGGDDLSSTRTAQELLGKSQNFRDGVPVLGSERHGTPFEEMSAQYDDARPLIDYLKRDPHELVKEKAVVFPAVGDQSAAGKRLVQVGQTPLVNPTDLQGGFEFSRDVFGHGEDPAGWASRPVAANLMASRLAARTKPGEVPYLTSVAMGTPAVDSTHMSALTLINMIPNSKIAKADLAKFNADMAKQLPGWPGIENTEAVTKFIDPRRMPGTKVSLIAKTLDKAAYRKTGFPDPGEVRFAVSEPRLLGLPQGSSGFTLMKVKPTGETLKEGHQHGTYAQKIPSPEGYSGGFPHVTPVDKMFPEWYGKQLPKTKGDPTLLQQSLMTQFPRQKADNEWADGIAKYWEDNPMPWGYANGGRVGFGEGGIAKALLKLLGPAEREGLMTLTRPGSGYSSVPGKPSKVHLPHVGEVEAKPIPQIMDAASGYMAARGMPGAHEITSFPELDIERARRIAKAFAAMKDAPDDPDVLRTYQALADETMDQFKAAKDTGIDFKAIRGDDPYANSPAIGYADIAERGRLQFFPTDAGFGSSIEHDASRNPLLKRVGKIGDLDNATVNDAFRVVHDLFGHYGPGNPFFRGPGEERAYLLHRKMFSDDAVPAMTSETRGQNSWLNYGPHGEANKTAKSADTTFADQKVGILPPWVYREGRADGGAVTEALRIARDVGGGVFMTDAQGRQYDAQGNVLAPATGTTANSSSAASDVPQAVEPTRQPVAPAAPAPAQTGSKQAQDIAAKAVNDPALFDALLEKHLNPDADIKRYEAMRDEVKNQSADVQGATHLGAKPKRDVVIDAPLFGGEHNLGSDNYDVANAKQLALQTLYDFKTAPVYATPFAPAALAADTGESVMTGDPTAALLGIGFGPGGKYAKALASGVAAYGMNATDAQAGPERWFSKLGEVAEALPMAKMGGEQAIAMLRKAVSPEELRWTGTDVFLQGQKQVTKQDLVDYIQKNRVKLNEIKLGGPGPKSLDDISLFDVPDEIKEKYRPEMDPLVKQNEDAGARMRSAKASMDDNQGYDVDYDRYFDAHAAAAKEYTNTKAKIIALNQKVKQEYADSIGGLALKTKYHRYSTQGGEGYNETLYQFDRPNSYGKFFKKLKEDFTQHLRDKMEEQGVPHSERNDYINAIVPHADADAMARALGRTDEFERVQKNTSYMSGHWQQPDVAFHTRGQTLSYDPPGSNRPYKVHNVDETQSDPGQAGRKSGFKDPEKYEQWRQEEKQINDAIRDTGIALGQIGMKYEGQLGVAPLRGEAQQSYHTRLQELLDADPEAKKLRGNLEVLRNKLVANQEAKPKSGSVPIMPFITNTEGWTDRAIKHELDKALDSDADYFSWTPGEVHADRYNLRNHVGELRYNPSTQTFYAEDRQGQQIINKQIKDPKELDELIGKEAADRLRDGAAAQMANIKNQYKVVESDTPGTFHVQHPDKTWFKYDDGEPVPFYSQEDAMGHVNDQVADGYAYGHFSPFTLSGDGLEMGGEGMINYYGKIYLNRVKKMLEKATGIKDIPVEIIEPQTANGPRKQLGIKLTDEMREKARFSDFAKGGTVTGFEKRDTSPAVSRALALTSGF